MEESCIVLIVVVLVARAEHILILTQIMIVFADLDVIHQDHGIVLTALSDHTVKLPLVIHVVVTQLKKY